MKRISLLSARLRRNKAKVEKERERVREKEREKIFKPSTKAKFLISL